MPTAPAPTLKPRKTPIQARSNASVDAILQATLQVLVSLGKERLTTTRVALRAGVSVGTLYQYFPNKSALLQAALRHHMDQVRHSIETVCAQHEGDSLLDMGTALIHAYLAAKMQNVKASSDIDGAAIAKTASHRSRRAIVALFATAREPLTKDPEVIANAVVSALNGFSRSLLESKSPELQLESMRAELIILVHAYLRTCIATAPSPKTSATHPPTPANP